MSRQQYVQSSSRSYCCYRIVETTVKEKSITCSELVLVMQFNKMQNNAKHYLSIRARDARITVARVVYVVTLVALHTRGRAYELSI